MTERDGRWARGLASLALLVGLVVGVPAALLALGGNPLPQRWDPAGLWRVLLSPDDGTVLARLLALVGWAAWVVFALTLVVELVNLVRRRSRAVVLPGLGGVQQWAAGLMLAVVALGGAAQLSSGPAPPNTVVARAVPASDPVTRPASPPPPGVSALPAAGEVPTVAVAGSADPPAGPALAAPRGGDRPTVHVVRVGDDLWSLAERYYGRGQDWRRIAMANPGRLTGGPDRLEVGWRLVIPDADRAQESPGDGVRVRRGDTLSSIAARVLGDAGRWPELYRANREQLADPDALPVGLVLQVPAEGEWYAGDHSSDRSGSGGAHTGPSEAGTRTTPAEPDESDPSSTLPASPAPAPTSEPTSEPTTEPTSEPTSETTAPSASAPTSAATAASSGPTAPAATTPVPGAPVSSAAARSAAVPSAAVPSETAEDSGPSLLVPGLATVGGLLAASLVGGVAARRRWQLQRRAVGRRIAHPPASTQPVEVELGRRSRPIGLRTLDRASRAVAAACHEAGIAVPGLRGASLSTDWLVLELEGPTPPAPRCFVDTGGTWCLSADAADGLRTVPGVGDAARPWPLLVTLGVDDEGAERVVDLESHGLLAVEGDDAGATAFLAAVALELACSPWTDDLRLVLVGDERLAPALAQHNVTTEPDLDAVLDRLELVARDRRENAGGRSARDLRQDVDLGDAWTPEVVLMGERPSPEQAGRLLRLLTDVPGTGLSAVVRGPLEGVSSRLVLGAGRARLLPDDVGLVPQTLPVEGLDPLVDLVSATSSEDTSPAPWWSSSEPLEPPPDNVTYLGRRRRDERDEDERRAAVQARMTEAVDGRTRHPLLRLIGPVDLLGATGPAPSRAARQCLEYCAWLLEHPGATAQDMATGLLVAEGTRRSNMSRLRTWLGDGPDGRAYLPDAYSGRIRLDVAVSSDWHELQVLLGDGVDRASSPTLELGLRLVRGAPLADAAPVQWHWAEALRTDIVSCVRDMGVELAARCTEDRDLDLARWAATRAQAVAPSDELLMAARIRIEHLAGNVAETERLCLRLAQDSRTLGVDLRPETVDLLQEVMEGRVRTRLA